MRFAALDFETAAGPRDTACALGVCLVEDGQVVEQREWLIRPPGNEYGEYQIRIHGIRPEDTVGAPEFPDVLAEAWPVIAEYPLVAHNASFDMSVLRRGFEMARMDYPHADYFCTLVASRLHWPQLPAHSLPIVCAHCGRTHRHHDSGEDALAAAQIALRVASEVGRNTLDSTAAALGMRMGRLRAWGYSPCSGGSRACGPTRTPMKNADFVVNSDADPGHPLFDADVAFTGTLLSMERDTAKALVGECGGRPRTSVSKRTEYLVVGSIEYHSLATGQPSAKMQKALALREEGHPLVILSEQEFLEYVATEPAGCEATDGADMAPD